MTKALGPLTVQRKTGAERLHDGSTDLGVDLLDFWQWHVSDLVSNTMRGHFAEYLVARALGITTGVREEWAAYDLKTSSGILVEVKSAAFLQTWQQTQLSTITFKTRKTRAWDTTGDADATTAHRTEPTRQAAVYVFALLHHTDKSTLDPLDVSQWRFYVVPTSDLDARARGQKSIGFNVLATMCKECATFHTLTAAVEAAAAQNPSR